MASDTQTALTAALEMRDRYIANGGVVSFSINGRETRFENLEAIDRHIEGLRSQLDRENSANPGKGTRNYASFRRPR